MFSRWISEYKRNRSLCSLKQKRRRLKKVEPGMFGNLKDKGVLFENLDEVRKSK